MLTRTSKMIGADELTPNERDTLRFGHGATVPTDGTAGYMTGALFMQTDGGEGTALYVNEGDGDSCDFNAVASLTAAQEALLGATAGVATASKALILDSNGHINSGTMILEDMTQGAGVTGAEALQHSVIKVGGLFYTTILVDLTGLKAGGTAGDIIGDDAAAAAHLGQITAAKNGTIYGGRMTCLEAPAGPVGGNDIDLYSAAEGTGAEDAAISTLTETQLCNSGALSAGSVVNLTAPAANEYLYLVDQGGGDAAYTAGRLLIELWGV